jgi:hypothetical protein
LKENYCFFIMTRINFVDIMSYVSIIVNKLGRTWTEASVHPYIRKIVFVIITPRTSNKTLIFSCRHEVKIHKISEDDWSAVRDSKPGTSYIWIKIRNWATAAFGLKKSVVAL